MAQSTFYLHYIQVLDILDLNFGLFNIMIIGYFGLMFGLDVRPCDNYCMYLKK